jgi:hypothetical protein
MPQSAFFADGFFSHRRNFRNGAKTRRLSAALCGTNLAQPVRVLFPFVALADGFEQPRQLGAMLFS